MDRSEPIVVVTGFGRCGSSLVMQMLDAGGYPVYGGRYGYPAYEADEVTSLPDASRWLAAAEGKAVKILDVHRHTPPRGRRYRWIWLDRDPEQQARSQLKFGFFMFGVETDLETAVPKFTESYRGDRPQCWRVMERLGGEILTLRFEELLSDPEGTAAKLGAFLRSGFKVESASTVVRSRPSDCLPYLLELQLIRERETATK